MARRMAQNGAPTHEIERQGRWKQRGRYAHVVLHTWSNSVANGESSEHSLTNSP